MHRSLETRLRQLEQRRAPSALEYRVFVEGTLIEEFTVAGGLRRFAWPEIPDDQPYFNKHTVLWHSTEKPPGAPLGHP